ncbi:MAG: L-threonylcarbamoyladenylate synthase [Chthoniobacterales bacterium]|nr:L-threonylcarbamoyladenylate synthase [Chthoniobacterales bacterium]
MIATEVLHPAKGEELTEEELARVVRLLQQGEVVALPTETVYGLAAKALDVNACRKIFEAKQRPFTDPLICHFDGLEMVKCFTHIEDEPVALKLAELFWPGPLTIVVRKKPLVPDLVTAGLPRVAVRISCLRILNQIIRRLGEPLAAPSANRFGRVSPTCAEHVLEELGGRIPLIIDGGVCYHGLESTIVLVEGGRVRLLRRGPIPVQQLLEVPGIEVIEDGREEDIAPGRMAWHYAPRARVKLFVDLPNFDENVDGPKRGCLSFQQKVCGRGWTKCEVLSEKGDLAEAGQKFYAALRELDRAGVDEIWAELLPDEGLGQTLNERLRKAAAKG